jgi:hypothetical protein
LCALRVPLLGLRGGERSRVDGDGDSGGVMLVIAVSIIKGTDGAAAADVRLPSVIEDEDEEGLRIDIIS